MFDFNSHVNQPKSAFELTKEIYAQRQAKQAIDEGALDLKQKQQDMADQQTARDVLTQTQGDVEKALPILRTKVSPKLYGAIEKSHTEHLQQVNTLDAQTRAAAKDKNDKILGVTSAAAQLPDDQFAASRPQLASALTELLGKPVDPNTLTKDQLKSLQLGSMTFENYLKGTKEARDAQEAAAKQPILDAEAEAVKKFGPTDPKIVAAEYRFLISKRNQGAKLTPEEDSKVKAYEKEKTLVPAMRVSMQQAASNDDLDLTAQSIAAGDLTRLKDVATLRGSERLRLFAKVKRLNPQFSTADLDRQIKMEDWITNGKGGEQMQSFGTFLEHGGAASDAVSNIRLSSSPLINKPINWWREHASGDPNYTALIASLEPVRKEFEGFLLGGRALYADDRKAAETILSDNSSPAQIQAALKQLGHTAQARANEINFRYKRVRHKDLEDAFSPEAIEGAKKIGVEVGFGPKKEAAQDFSVTDPNGKVHPFDSQAEADAFRKLAGIK